MLAYSTDLIDQLATSSSADRTKILLLVKNAIIGHKERKEQLVMCGKISYIVQVLDSSIADDEDTFKIQALHAAAIIGSLPTGTIACLYVLLVEQVHTALFTALSRIIAGGVTTTASSSTADAPLFDSKYNKLVITLVRSIKNLYLDIGLLTGTALLGTFTSTTSHLAGQIDSSDGTTILYAWEAGAIPSLGNSALETLFQSSPSSPYEPYIPSPQNPPSALDSILLLLIDSRAKPGSSSLHHAKLSEMICTLLAAVIRTPQQRLAIQCFLCEREGRHATGALLSLIRWRAGKVQEVALDALSAFIFDSPRTAGLVQSLVDPYDEHNVDFADFITTLTRDTRPSLRLSAASCLTTLWKSSPVDSIKFLIPILLNLMSEATPLSTNAILTMAYLISGDEALQAQVLILKFLPMLQTVKNQVISTDVPYNPPDKVLEDAQLLESILLALASLSDTSEPHRRALSLHTALFQFILTSLTSPAPRLRLAAAKALRRVSRSTNVLRTSLMAPAVTGRSFSRLLVDIQNAVGEDSIEVIDEVMGLIANLLLDFSPLREPLLLEGTLHSLTENIEATVKFPSERNDKLLMNRLCALRNSTYASSIEFKFSLIQGMNGFDHLLSLINDTRYPEEVASQCLSIILNLSCQSNKEGNVSRSEDSDDYNVVLNGMGESVLFNMLEEQMMKGIRFISRDVLRILVNVATAGEPAKAAIMRRPLFLQTILTFLDDNDAVLRASVAWLLINLTYQKPHTTKDEETIAMLRSLGVEDRLRRLSLDVSLDVRERVSEALKAFE